MPLDNFVSVVEDYHHITFSDVFERDPDRFWRLKSNVTLPADSWPIVGLVSNSAGFREDHEIPRVPAAREARILFVGDSFTFGVYVPPEDTIVQFAEDALQRRLPNWHVECINAGVPGYTIFQGWRFLLDEGFDYQPDVIVLQFGWNALATWDDLGDALYHAEWVAAQPPGPLRRSRVFHRLWRLRAQSAQAVESPSAPGSQPRPRLLLDEYTALLRTIHEEAERRGVQVLLLVPPAATNVDPATPWRRSEYQQATIDYSRRILFGPDYRPGLVDGIPTGQALMRDHGVRDLFFQDGSHAKPLLAEALGQLLADKIEPLFKNR